jgi:hypothetical protein
MVPFLIAFLGAVLSSIAMEFRHPLQFSSGGWVWAMRAIHLSSFFVLSLLVVGLVASYI